MTRTKLPDFLGEIVELARPVRPQKGWLSTGGAAAAKLVTNFQVDAQERTEWCWAAVSQALLRKYGRSLRQCEVVSDFHRDSAKNCCSDGGLENKSEYFEAVLSWFKILRGNPGRGAIDRAVIVQEIEGQRPFCIQLDYIDRSHIVGVAGYRVAGDGSLMLLIGDSQFGGVPIETPADPFTYGGAAWGWSFLTKRVSS